MTYQEAIKYLEESGYTIHTFSTYKLITHTVFPSIAYSVEDEMEFIDLAEQLKLSTGLEANEQ